MAPRHHSSAANHRDALAMLLPEDAMLDDWPFDTRPGCMLELRY